MTTFDHVHICCTDLNAMIEFWKNAFGAEFVRLRKFGTADGAVLTLAGTQIFLKEIPEGPPCPMLPPAVSITWACVWTIPTPWRKPLSTGSAAV